METTEYAYRRVEAGSNPCRIRCRPWRLNGPPCRLDREPWDRICPSTLVSADGAAALHDTLNFKTANTWKYNEQSQQHENNAFNVILTPQFFLSLIRGRLSLGARCVTVWRNTRKARDGWYPRIPTLMDAEMRCPLTLPPALQLQIFELSMAAMGVPYL